MKKRYLLSYNPAKWDSLNSTGFNYILSLKIIWLWGLFNTYTEVKKVINFNDSVTTYKNHWDYLIMNNINIKWN